jgi:hypothetical protein
LKKQVSFQIELKKLQQTKSQISDKTGVRRYNEQKGH